MRKRKKRKGPRAAVSAEHVAHQVLTKVAKLAPEDAVGVAIAIIESVVVSNTDESDPDDRADMIEEIELRFIEAMFDLNPNVEHAHAWLVPPQGLITEPVGFLWAGSDGDGVRVMFGEDLAALRAEIDEIRENTCVVVTEGVDGIAMASPDWDGKPTIACDNPLCNARHDVHLMFAEHLFTTAKQPAVTN